MLAKTSVMDIINLKEKPHKPTTEHISRSAVSSSMILTAEDEIEWNSSHWQLWVQKKNQTQNMKKFKREKMFIYMFLFMITKKNIKLKFFISKKSLEKEMTTHSNILAWRIAWTEEPGGLQPKGSQRVGHDWATSHIHTHISKK